MVYREPPDSLSKLSVAHSHDRQVVSLQDSAGAVLEIRFLANIGWWIELRYDIKFADVHRQPLTGAQAELESLLPEIKLSGNEALVSAGSSDMLRFNLLHKSFQACCNGMPYFEATHMPFRSHAKYVDVCEGIMSLKLTDFRKGEFITPDGSTFRSRMTRFCYNRPNGLVLGLPGQTGELNRNGYRFELYNTDQFNHTPARLPMYQSWPILFHKPNVADNSSGWVCIFHDNPSRTFVDLGDFYPELITFESVSGNTRVFILSARSLEELCTKLSRLLGGAAFPPQWAFGYQQCRWSYMSTDEVRCVAKQMREHEIPCDALYFDIDYMDQFRVFTRNPHNFADMKECISELHQSGLHAACIIDPGVKIDEKYGIYKELLASECYLSTPSGQPLVAKVWPGDSILPDFSQEKLREIWSDFELRWLQEYEFDGIWNDMNEPSNFDGQNAKTSKALGRAGPFRDEYNLYGYWMARASALGWEKYKPDERSLIISRSGYPGLQRFAVIWHGDNQAWWEHLRLALETCLQYSLSGAYYTGPDVPGFTGNAPDDLAVRFFQLGAWLPFFRGHSIKFAKDKEPYAFGAEAAHHIRAAINLRYSLLREWYSGFERCVRLNIAPLMPVITAGGKLARDQLVLFGKFLVAPVVERDAEQRSVYLPEGSWYTLGDPSCSVDGARWISVPVTLETIPVFVKSGSIVVRNTPKATTALTLSAPEQFEIYRNDAGVAEGYWYGDDGRSKKDPNCTRLNLLVSAESEKIEASCD